MLRGNRAGPTAGLCGAGGSQGRLDVTDTGDALAPGTRLGELEIERVSSDIRT